MTKRTKKLDLVQPGSVFGHLTVIELIPSNNLRHRYATCECRCGLPGCRKTTRTRVDHLTSGRTKGCRACAGKWTHQQASKKSLHRAAFRAWESMFWRCDNPEHEAYGRYGGRGITICQQWRDSFLSFLEDMGDPPKGLTLDRIDNDGNYEPGNCRWATRTQQQRNRTKNRRLTLHGVTLCVAEWAEKLGVKRDVLYDRLRRDWTDEATLTTPVASGIKNRYGAAAFRAPTHIPTR